MSQLNLKLAGEHASGSNKGWPVRPPVHRDKPPTHSSSFSMPENHKPFVRTNTSVPNATNNPFDMKIVKAGGGNRPKPRALVRQGSEDQMASVVDFIDSHAFGYENAAAVNIQRIFKGYRIKKKVDNLPAHGKRRFALAQMILRPCDRRPLRITDLEIGATIVLQQWLRTKYKHWKEYKPPRRPSLAMRELLERQGLGEPAAGILSPSHVYRAKMKKMARERVEVNDDKREAFYTSAGTFLSTIAADHTQAGKQNSHWSDIAATARSSFAPELLQMPSFQFEDAGLAERKKKQRWRPVSGHKEQECPSEPPKRRRRKRKPLPPPRPERRVDETEEEWEGRCGPTYGGYEVWSSGSETDTGSVSSDLSSVSSTLDIGFVRTKRAEPLQQVTFSDPSPPPPPPPPQEQSVDTMAALAAAMAPVSSVRAVSPVQLGGSSSESSPTVTSDAGSATYHVSEMDSALVAGLDKEGRWVPPRTHRSGTHGQQQNVTGWSENTNDEAWQRADAVGRTPTPTSPKSASSHGSSRFTGSLGTSIGKFSGWDRSQDAKSQRNDNSRPSTAPDAWMDPRGGRVGVYLPSSVPLVQVSSTELHLPAPEQFRRYFAPGHSIAEEHSAPPLQHHWLRKGQGGGGAPLGYREKLRGKDGRGGGGGGGGGGNIDVRSGSGSPKSGDELGGVSWRAEMTSSRAESDSSRLIGWRSRVSGAGAFRLGTTESGFVSARGQLTRIERVIRSIFTQVKEVGATKVKHILQQDGQWVPFVSAHLGMVGRVSAPAALNDLVTQDQISATTPSHVKRVRRSEAGLMAGMTMNEHRGRTHWRATEDTFRQSQPRKTSPCRHINTDISVVQECVPFIVFMYLEATGVLMVLLVSGPEKFTQIWSWNGGVMRDWLGPSPKDSASRKQFAGCPWTEDPQWRRFMRLRHCGWGFPLECLIDEEWVEPSNGPRVNAGFALRTSHTSHTQAIVSAIRSVARDATSRPWDILNAALHFFDYNVYEPKLAVFGGHGRQVGARGANEHRPVRHEVDILMFDWARRNGRSRSPSPQRVGSGTELQSNLHVASESGDWRGGRSTNHSHDFTSGCISNTAVFPPRQLRTAEASQVHQALTGYVPPNRGGHTNQRRAKTASSSTRPAKRPSHSLTLPSPKLTNPDEKVAWYAADGVGDSGDTPIDSTSAPSLSGIGAHTGDTRDGEPAPSFVDTKLVTSDDGDVTAIADVCHHGNLASSLSVNMGSPSTSANAMISDATNGTVTHLSTQCGSEEAGPTIDLDAIAPPQDAAAVPIPAGERPHHDMLTHVSTGRDAESEVTVVRPSTSGGATWTGVLQLSRDPNKEQSYIVMPPSSTVVIPRLATERARTADNPVHRQTARARTADAAPRWRGSQTSRPRMSRDNRGHAAMRTSPLDDMLEIPMRKALTQRSSHDANHIQRTRNGRKWEHKTFSIGFATRPSLFVMGDSSELEERDVSPPRHLDVPVPAVGKSERRIKTAPDSKVRSSIASDRYQRHGQHGHVDSGPPSHISITVKPQPPQSSRPKTSGMRNIHKYVVNDIGAGARRRRLANPPIVNIDLGQAGQRSSESNDHVSNSISNATKRIDRNANPMSAEGDELSPKYESTYRQLPKPARRPSVSTLLSQKGVVASTITTPPKALWKTASQTVPITAAPRRSFSPIQGGPLQSWNDHDLRGLNADTEMMVQASEHAAMSRLRDGLTTESLQDNVDRVGDDVDGIENGGESTFVWSSALLRTRYATANTKVKVKVKVIA